MHRRAFLKQTSLAAAAISFPFVLRAQGKGSSNSRLNVACVGVGGRGRAAVRGVAGENHVAFCDVDDVRAAPTFAEFPAVPRFRDYRRMLDQLDDRIDAVTISTPDHMHYPIAVAAMSLGKHVYVEKPMTHTIRESRHLVELAREKRVATQMGNQGHSNEGPRLLKEWFQAGVLGEVREIHSWTDRPIWPQGISAPDHAKTVPAAPASLDWDLWLGVAAARDYDQAYLPFNWRGHWDFGTGALGDMGCHFFDGAYWALDLTPPTWLEPVSVGQTEVSGPKASIVTYHFPARGQLPPVKWTWYDGGLQPPLPPELAPGRKLPVNGVLIVGSKATVLTTDHIYTSLRIIPEIKMQEMAPDLPPKTLRRITEGHFGNWINACKGGEPAGSNFEYASGVNEAVLLGCVAIRAGRSIEWNSAAMKIPNVPEAERFLTKLYRPGFGV